MRRKDKGRPPYTVPISNGGAKRGATLAELMLREGGEVRDSRMHIEASEGARASQCECDREESGSTNLYDHASRARIAHHVALCVLLPTNLAPSTLPPSLPPLSPLPLRSCLRSRTTTDLPPYLSPSLLAYFPQSCPLPLPCPVRPLGNAIGKSFASQSLARPLMESWGKGGRQVRFVRRDS